MDLADVDDWSLSVLFGHGMRAWRLLALGVGLLAMLVLVVAGARPASAQTRVGPQHQQVIFTVEAQTTTAQTGTGLHGLPLRLTVSATGVAADAGATAAADAGAGKTVAVIGRLPDTSVAKGWAGHEILDIPDWTIAKNDQWVQSVVDRKMPVYVGSPTTWPNLWDATAGRTTVFGRELQQFTNAGYTWDGWAMVPPGG